MNSPMDVVDPGKTGTVPRAPRGRNRELVLGALRRAGKPLVAYDLLRLPAADGLRSSLQVDRALDVHPTRTLDAWPSDDHRTRLVFITDGIAPEPVRALFAAVLETRPRPVRPMLVGLAAGLGKRFGYRAAAMRARRAQTRHKGDRPWPSQ